MEAARVLMFDVMKKPKILDNKVLCHKDFVVFNNQNIFQDQLRNANDRKYGCSLK